MEMKIIKIIYEVVSGKKYNSIIQLILVNLVECKLSFQFKSSIHKYE